MKKNAMLKIAAILMVAVLLTTCAISSTFAKYVTTGSTSSTARVAKWGVNVNVSANDSAFAKVYKNGSNTVVNSADYVIAPGTKNDNAVSVSITGNPEVAATVAFTKTKGNTQYFNLVGEWGSDTLPITFYVTVNDTKTAYNGTAAKLVEDVNKALDTAFAAQSFTPGATTEDGDPIVLNTSVVIGWEWEYEVADNDKTDDNEQALRDALDTALGNAAANATQTKLAPAIAINFAVSVTQTGTEWATMVTETVAP